MSVKIADKIVQYNNGSYFLMDSSAVEYIDKNGNSQSLKDVLDNTSTDRGGSSEKQIKDWVSGSSYLEGDYIYHEGEIYRCLASNNDVDFDEANWKQLTYGIDELSKEDVERLLGLTEEEIEAMADLISDTEVRIDKTYSSSKIYTDIQQCLEDSKTFTLLELGKFSGASYKVVASTSEMTSKSIIYLLANGNTYDMYIVEENGATTKIGNTQIDLSNYYTKTEIDNDFLKKVNADGKYATITTVDGKVDKDKIVTVLDDTVTDEQILNALALKELLDEKNVENLFPIQYYNNTSDVRNGITATINNDRSITFKGTTTEPYFFVLWHKDKNGLGKAVTLRGKTITMTGGLASPTLSLAFYDEEGNNITPPDNTMKYDFGNGLTIKVPDNAYSVYSYYYSSAGAKLDCTVYPMLEIGNVAHDYCPPNGTALTKGDIGDSINSDSTADEIVSAKLAYTNFIRGNFVGQSYLDEIGTNDVLQFPEGKYIIPENVTYANLPEGVKGGYLEIWNMNGKSYETPFNSAWKYRVVKLQDFGSKESYYRVLRSGTSDVFLDTGWQRVCVTTVADVSETSIEFDETALGLTISGSRSSYKVINGICYVTIELHVDAPSDYKTYGYVKINTTSLPKIGFATKAVLNVVEANSSISTVLDKGSTDIKLHGNILNKEGTYVIQGSFSYPVAES